MNSKEINQILSKEYHFPLDLSHQILKTILKSIRDELRQGNIVRLRNFGTFQAKKSHGKFRAKFDDSKNFFKNPF